MAGSAATVPGTRNRELMVKGLNMLVRGFLFRAGVTHPESGSPPRYAASSRVTFVLASTSRTRVQRARRRSRPDFRVLVCGALTSGLVHRRITIKIAL